MLRNLSKLSNILEMQMPSMREGTWRERHKVRAEASIPGVTGSSKHTRAMRSIKPLNYVRVTDVMMWDYSGNDVGLTSKRWVIWPTSKLSKLSDLSDPSDHFNPVGSGTIVGVLQAVEEG